MSTKTIAKSALWVTLSEIIFNLSGFIIHSVLGRMLGPGDYGRYSLIITLTTTIIILIGNGIPTAMAKYISEIFESKPKTVGIIKKQAVLIQSFIMGSITILFFLAAPVISGILGDPTLTPLFRLSSLIIPAFAAASFYFSYYTGLHRFNLQAILKTTRSFFRIGFVIVLAYFFSIKGAVAGYILAPGAVFIIALALDKFKVSKELENIPEEKEKASFEWKKLVNYAWQIIVFFLAYELLISIDLYLVKGILQNDAVTGLYNAALTVGRIPYYIFYALTVFMLPMVSRSTSKNDRKETGKIINQAIRIMVISLVPMVIAMSIFAEPILNLLYGSEFIGAAHSMSILVFGVGFLTIFYVLSFALNGAGKTKLAMWISMAGLAVNTILNYVLIKEYGIIGSAIATSIASFLIMLMILFHMNKNFGVTIKIATIAKVLLAGIIMYIISAFLPSGNLIFSLWFAILFIAYFFALYILGEIGKGDVEIIKSILKKKNPEEIKEELSGTEPGA